MLKFSFSIITLLAIGIILTFSLPKFQSASSKSVDKNNYTINQDALLSPSQMQDFLLVTPIPDKTSFTLRLGLYSQLQQAVAAAESMVMPNKTVIVKVIDNNREWYFLLLGQYQTALQAEQKKQELKNQKISATLMLWPKDLVL